ncbi:MAG TPA: acyl-ACP--UDP-N-acetylglucosamine O-acyltransferase [Syntrophales bacterium]|nr:acyl-ACP--UDP-N-acetylglucosamine O-acyltransferase [Syntrophales bacterium]HOM06172.1 acyl-ACP--UDP-N-acetylglucosamine O-acyltransferase [Syntrophales bacterium]HON98964.1 acyl-ACP--UDP-N-acetylglucosamine O-acyltransferase [Syntrophales bacterium]HPC01026.1 acyl-ACP--UDP-N-acetylglucosamine O-acyltransferase [Syntrophales bacterium]HPQ05655.1 acyl-ACP--UDP-N-acetylglucosamine O-acyltransferase [Syntrophales bacterium]
MNIHPTAVVSPEAVVSEGVEIGPYSIIGPDVTIGMGTKIGPHVVIEAHTDIGEGCRIYPFASIGAAPQDLKFRGEVTRVIIGRFNTIREFATIHRATAADIGVTVLGDHNLIMAYCHVAHNCKLGNHIVMANAANLAGHIHVEDYAIIGGMTGIHQFTRIGAHCIIGGCSAVPKDIPPYVMASGNMARLYGLNMIGLRRRGFKEETIAALKAAYRIVFRSKLLLRDALLRVRDEVPDLPEVRHFLAFIENSQRGVCRK